jgi:hypothetical protein
MDYNDRSIDTVIFKSEQKKDNGKVNRKILLRNDKFCTLQATERAPGWAKYILGVYRH